MGTLSNCLGYRALEDFGRRHQQALVERLKLPPMRFPSDSTFRRVMMGIDFTQLAKVFSNWTRDWMPTQQQDWLGVDGKSIKATVSNYDKAYQDFVNVVSVFSSRQGIAIAIIRSLAIALLRHNGYSSITTAVRMIGHNLEQIFLLLAKVAH